jgi:hypothetical protein
MSLVLLAPELLHLRLICAGYEGQSHGTHLDAQAQTRALFPRLWEAEMSHSTSPQLTTFVEDKLPVGGSGGSVVVGVDSEFGVVSIGFKNPASSTLDS